MKSLLLFAAGYLIVSFVLDCIFRLVAKRIKRRWLPDPVRRKIRYVVQGRGEDTVFVLECGHEIVMEQGWEADCHLCGKQVAELERMARK